MKRIIFNLLLVSIIASLTPQITLAQRSGTSTGSTGSAGSIGMNSGGTQSAPNSSTSTPRTGALPGGNAQQFPPLATSPSIRQIVPGTIVNHPYGGTTAAAIKHQAELARQNGALIVPGAPGAAAAARAMYSPSMVRTSGAPSVDNGTGVFAPAGTASAFGGSVSPFGVNYAGQAVLNPQGMENANIGAAAGMRGTGAAPSNPIGMGYLNGQFGNSQLNSNVRMNAPLAQMNRSATFPGAAQMARVDPNGWRFVNQNGQWWYWTPQNNWLYYRQNAWNSYDASAPPQAATMEVETAPSGGAPEPQTP